jgi:hypothetical protein
VRLTAAWAGDSALICRRLEELQQLTEGRCASLMQGGTEGHLHRLQIQSPVRLRWAKTRLSSVLTSCATSAWIAAAGY